jgi:hypothetical protein
MDLPTLTMFLNARVDELANQACCCGFTHVLTPYNETKKLVQACGYDTSEFERAINVADQALTQLEMARDKVACRFKADGVCFVVDESRRKEIEMAWLQ